MVRTKMSFLLLSMAAGMFREAGATFTSKIHTHTLPPDHLFAYLSFSFLFL
jgi:formate/nitrite transporter FocA (FNT family)